MKKNGFTLIELPGLEKNKKKIKNYITNKKK